MPLFPNSWGVELAEFNPCHRPAGRPDGGQFCAKQEAGLGPAGAEPSDDAYRARPPEASFVRVFHHVGCSDEEVEGISRARDQLMEASFSGFPPVESGISVTDSGRVLGEPEVGEEDFIDLVDNPNQWVQAAPQTVTFCHTHPGGGPFSLDDVLETCRYNAGQRFGNLQKIAVFGEDGSTDVIRFLIPPTPTQLSDLQERYEGTLAAANSAALTILAHKYLKRRLDRDTDSHEAADRLGDEILAAAHKRGEYPEDVDRQYRHERDAIMRSFWHDEAQHSGWFLYATSAPTMARRDRKAS